MHKNEEQYHALVEKLDDGYCVIEMIYDADGKAIDYRFIEINSAFEKHTGLHHALGKTILQMVPNHDAYWFETYGRVAQTGESIRFEDAATAMHRYYSVFAFRIGGSASHRVGVLFRDITEKKKSEKDIIDARIAADAANRAKSEFIANMSHELRTPLNAVIGFSEVLVDEKFGPLNEIQKDYLGDILESGKFLLSLINDILDLAKIESGKMQLEASDFSLKELIKHSVVLFKEKALKNRIQMVLNIADDVGHMWADERKIKQVIFNLLSNAMKFTPGGGTVGIDAKIDDSEIEIAVWDTGIGIPKADQHKLFEDFVQLDNSLGNATKGTGLGLSLTKKFVELHQGKIWVESEGDHAGSSFKIRLPLNG